jgi:hypothetical protein
MMQMDENDSGRWRLPPGISVTLLLTSTIWSCLAIALAINAAHSTVLEKFTRTILIVAVALTAAGMVGAGVAIDQLLRERKRTTRLAAAWLWVNAGIIALGAMGNHRYPHHWPGPEILTANGLMVVGLAAREIWRRRSRVAVEVIAAGLALGFAGVCRADTLSLPLQGYFHPGRAMPVAWEIGRPGSIELWAEGAARSRVASGNTGGVFPFLTFDRDLGQIRWRVEGGGPQEVSWRLHPLEDSQRLVAMEVDDPAAARQLFSARSIVPIVLDASQTVRGPAMAWEALDGLVLKPQSFARLSPDFCRGLLAGGVTLAVTGSERPGGSLPWRRGSGLWIVATQLPLPSMSNEDAYAPAWGWSGGRSGIFRARVVLLGVLVCLAACGVGLWRSNWMPTAMVLLCGAMMLVGDWQNRRQSPVMSVAGMERLVGLPMPIADVWFYQASHRDCEFSVPVSGLVQPFVSDPIQLRQAQLTLSCDGSGAPIGVEGFLHADSPLCLMSRQIDLARDVPGLSEKINSPLRLLARGAIYPEFKLRGQVGDAHSDTRWATVVMQLRE